MIQGYHHRGEGQEYQNQSYSEDLMSRRVGGYNQSITNGHLLFVMGALIL